MAAMLAFHVLVNVGMTCFYHCIFSKPRRLSSYFATDRERLRRVARDWASEQEEVTVAEVRYDGVTTIDEVVRETLGEEVE